MTNKDVISERKFAAVNYPKVYQASQSSRIAAAIVCLVGGVVVPVLLLVVVYFMPGGRTSPTMVLIPLAVAMSALCLLSFRDTVRSRITLQPDRIDVHSAYKTWAVQRDQIVSWRMQTGKGYGVLELCTGDTLNPVRRVALHCKPDVPFFDWFIGIDNTDQAAHEHLLQAVRNNAQFGATPEQREAAYQSAGRSAKILQGMAVAISFWAIVYPYPQGAPIWMCIGLPWICILTAAFSKGMIRALHFDTINPANNLTVAFIAPAFALVVHTAATGNLLNWSDGLFWSAVVTVPYLIVVGSVTNWYERQLKFFVWVTVFCAMYGYGALVMTNQLLSLGTMERQRAIIIGYHETHGKGAAGYFTVTPWGPYKTANDIRVTWDRYNEMKLNQPICFTIHTGLLKVQWFDTDYCYLVENWANEQSNMKTAAGTAKPLSYEPIGKTVTVLPGTPHAWALTAGLALAAQSGMDPLKLGGWDVTQYNIVAVKTHFLERFWGIHNRDDLLAELLHLEQFGHRAEFERLGQYYEELATNGDRATTHSFDFGDLADNSRAQFAKLHYPAMKSKSLLSFDLVRVINVTRWGYLAGYLSEQEAWQHIMPAARRLQKTYSSWQDLTDNYVLGREFWGGDLEHQTEFAAIIQKAMYRPDSPTLANSWNMDLQ